MTDHDDDLSDWTEADLSRALGDGAETDLSRALAPLCVVALSGDAEARGTGWDCSWDDTLALGLKLRVTIQESLEYTLVSSRDTSVRWMREDLIVTVTRAIGDRKTAESLAAAYYRATKDARHVSRAKLVLNDAVERCASAYRALTA